MLLGRPALGLGRPALARGGPALGFGMTPEAVRFATDGYWEVGDLRAGSYLAEMNGQTYPVVVPSTGFAVLGQ